MVSEIDTNNCIELGFYQQIQNYELFSKDCENVELITSPEVVPYLFENTPLAIARSIGKSEIMQMTGKALIRSRVRVLEGTCNLWG